jgi:U4/U6.U5 tri-snRNP-associated protein 2
LCVVVQNSTILHFAHRFHSLCVDLDAPVSHLPTLYDLVANVTHESVAGTTRDKKNTVWKVHLRAGSGGGDGERWFQIQDLIVEETRKEMIFLGETVLQVAVFRPCVRQPDSDVRI